MRFPPPVAELIGFELQSMSGGESAMSLEVTERHGNPMGTVHGGILCDLADAAMGTAYVSTLEDGESFTTLELKINYLRPFWTGRLVARGRVIQRGQTVGLAECHIEDSEGRLVAYSTSTCMVLRGDAAAGR